MPSQLIRKERDSTLAASGAFQEQTSTTDPAANSPAASTADLFEDSVTKWLALRDIRTSRQTQEPETSQKPPTRPSQTLPELPPRPPVLKRPESVVGLKRWTGIILEITDGLLTVELIPTDHEGPRFHAEFELSLLSPDEETVQSGDIVYLTTRIIKAKSGYSTATTHLRLKRSGQWSEKEVAEIAELARQQSAYFEDAD